MTRYQQAERKARRPYGNGANTVRSVTAAAIMAGLAIAGGLASGGSALAEDPPTHFDFGGSVTWIGQVPIMVAIDKGFFKDEGLDVDFQTIISSGDRAAALTAGSIDFSNLGRAAVIADMGRGNEAYYFFANVDDSPGNEGCWARKGYSSWSDLRDKKVAANTSAEITMAGLLEKQDMSYDDIQFVNLPPNQMAPALANGDVQAACVWQPVLDKLKDAAPDGKLLGTDKDTAMYEKYGTMASPDIMIISRDLADNHPEQAGKLAKAVFRGADFANENPEEAAELIAHYFNRPADEILAQMKSFTYFGSEGWPKHIELHTQQMQALAQWLYDQNKIGNLPDVDKWVKTSFIPKP